MKTKQIEIKTLNELNSFLEKTYFWANGKNIKIDHLHTTCAESPRKYENLCAIYLTKPNYAWMGVWMAVTSRNKLRKRNLRYIKPDSLQEDHIGSLEIFSEKEDLEDCFCEQAFLYFFDPEKYKEIRVIDCSNVPLIDKIAYLKSKGFEDASFERKGELYPTYKFPSNEKVIVLVDEWQVALVNIERIVPDIEVYLGRGIIRELQGRVIKASSAVDDNYIVSNDT